MAPAAGKSSARKFKTVAQFQTEPMFKSERKFSVERGLQPPEPAATGATLDQPSLEEKLKDCMEKYSTSERINVLTSLVLGLLAAGTALVASKLLALQKLACT